MPAKTRAARTADKVEEADDTPFREKAPNADDDGPQTEHGDYVSNSINGVLYAIFRYIMLVDVNIEPKCRQ